QTNINDTATSAIGDVKTAKDNALFTMTNTMSEKVSEVENVSNEATKHVDDKLIEFNGLLETEGFLTPEGLGNQLDELEWQKYKLTNDDGTNHFVDIDYDIDILHNLPNGFHYAIKVPELPDGLSNKGSTSAGIMIVQSGNGTKRLFFVAYTNNLLFTKNFY